MNIGNKISELRTLIGWSQAELARQSGLTSSAISQIEAGDRRSPNFNTVIKILKSMNLTLSCLDDPGEITFEKAICAKFKLHRLTESDGKLILTIIDRLIGLPEAAK